MRYSPDRNAERGTQEPVDLTEDDPGDGVPEWVIRLMVQKSGEKTTWDV